MFQKIVEFFEKLVPIIGWKLKTTFELTIEKPDFIRTSCCFQALKKGITIRDLGKQEFCRHIPNLSKIWYSEVDRMKYLWYIFALNVFLPILMAQEENGQSCRRSIRIALQSIFEEWEANNTICVCYIFFPLRYFVK